MGVASIILSLGLFLADGHAQVSQAPTATLPIQPEALHVEIRRGIIIVPCTVAGISPLRCMLDTGSSMTGLAPELVQRLKLTPTAEPGASSFSARAYTLPSQRVQIGKNVFTVERVGMAPLEVVSKAIGENVDVLLGTSVFEQMQITIDPSALEVRIAASGAAVSSAARPMQVVTALHLPIGFVQMRTDSSGSIVVPFQIDTGSMPALLLGKPYFDGHAHLATSKPIHRTDDVLMTVDSIRFGEELHNVPAGEPLHPNGVLATRQLGGYLGAPVLNRFVITYDLGRSVMYVTPLPDIARPFDPLPATP